MAFRLRRHPPTPLLICAALLVIFYGVSLCAVWPKNATADEPMHMAGALAHARLLDFRINMEDPPLWHYFAALPHMFSPPTLPTEHPFWHAMPVQWNRQWDWSVHTLYRTPGNDPDRIINRSRAVMLLLGVALGGLIAWWSWKLAGPAAAVIATALFAFDPNFAAHAPLVKNDVSFTLAMLACAIALWKLGQAITPLCVLGVGLACGAGISVKFSGLLLPPIIILVLVARSLIPSPWPILRRSAASFAQRIAAAGASIFCIALIAYLTLWGAYGFRFAPTSDPQVRLNMYGLRILTADRHRVREHPERVPTPDEIRSWQPNLMVRAIEFADENRIVPHAWLAGLLYTHATTQVRTAYLLGNSSHVGWWYYFPLTMAFKTPLATLVALLGAAIVALLSTVGFMRSAERDRTQVLRNLWSAVCVALPGGVYLFSIITSNTNIGIRHALPAYPFLFIAAGIAGAEALRRWARWVKPTLALFLVVLTVELAWGFPHYIGFFNAPALAGSSQGLLLLSDSNLDWGQDLKLLADWRKANPDGKLYLCYFGTADPAYYGIDYVNLSQGYPYGGTPQVSIRTQSEPGYVAISASNLQFAPTEPVFADYYRFWHQEPVEVLGRSIYVYRFP